MDNILGIRLKELRERSNKTQKEVALVFGITNFQLSRYESGSSNPDPDLISKFADYYEVTSDYLLGRTNNPNPIQDIAAHRTDDHMDDLPEEAIQEVENFKAFIRSKYGKNNIGGES